jgi:YfiR/HmsC-like
VPDFSRGRAVLGCVALLLSAAAASAQSADSAPDYSIKAAYLYNFATYVEWPSAALGDGDASFVIGVLGDERVADYLASMTAPREVHGRPIEVRQVQRSDPLDSLHMLFIDRYDADTLPRLRAAAREHSVLLVTDWEGALESGSVINFRQVDQRIRFEVSLDAAAGCGLSVSSRMLAVAERVLPRSGEE